MRELIFLSLSARKLLRLRKRLDFSRCFGRLLQSGRWRRLPSSPDSWDLRLGLKSIFLKRRARAPLSNRLTLPHLGLRTSVLTHRRSPTRPPHKTFQGICSKDLRLPSPNARKRWPIYSH